MSVDAGPGIRNELHTIPATHFFKGTGPGDLVFYFETYNNKSAYSEDPVSEQIKEWLINQRTSYTSYL
jgi:hypothetical protein